MFISEAQSLARDMFSEHEILSSEHMSHRDLTFVLGTGIHSVVCNDLQLIFELI